MKCPKCGYNSFDYLDSCKKCGNDLVPFKESVGIRAVFLPPGQALAAGPPPDGQHLPQVDGEVALEPESREATGWETPPGIEPSVKSEESSFGFDMDFLGSEPSNTGQEKEAEPFSFDMEPLETLPETPVEPQQAREELFGEISFGDPGKQTPAVSDDAGKPGDEDFFADLLESASAVGSDPEDAWSAPGNASSSGEFQEFERGPFEHAAAEPTPVPPASTGEFEMDDLIPGEETPGAKTGKGPVIDTFGLSKDEFDSLFGDTAEVEEEKSGE